MSPPDIRDIRGPIAIPSLWVPVAIAVAALAVIAAAYLGIRWLRARARRRGRSPAEIALERIERARGLLGASAGPGVFGAEVSDAVRAYLEARFALPAAHRTTEELVIALMDAKVSAVAAAHRDVLEDFLSRCDLAKFARLAISADLGGSLADAARRLVEATASPLEAPQPKEASA